MTLGSSFFSDVKIGVQDPDYYVYEYENVRVCGAILEGCLERDLKVEYGTIDATALSMYLHICVRITQVHVIISESQ